MKRLPLIFSLLAVIALSASIAYWVMELYKPKQRPLAAMPQTSVLEPAPDAAATLFGGQALTVVASNYRLTGVVAAGRDSAAILVADGQPPQALKVGGEIAPGVTVREVHPRYVMLSEGGVLKRIELATDEKAGASMSMGMGAAPEDPNAAQAQQMQQQMQMQQMQQQQQQQQQMQQMQQQQPPQPMQVPQDNGGNNVQVPINNAPMEIPGNMPGGAPPGVQMPAPARNFSNPNPGGQPPTQ
jgi:general secretion pathway protein C